MTYIVPFIRRFSSIIRSVQSGTATISATNTSVDATILTVDKTKSFMFFSYYGTALVNNGNRNMVRGRIENNTTLIFDTTTAHPADSITIQWYVVEFTSQSGAGVQHGNVNINASTVNVTISAVDMTRSFPIHSFKTVATGFGTNEFMSVELTSSTNLKFEVTGSDSRETNYQIISVPSWTVAKYTDTILATESTKNTAITAVDLNKTMLIATGNYKPNLAGFDAREIPRCGLTNSTTVSAKRNTAVYPVNLIYHVVTMTDEVKSVTRDLDEGMATLATTSTDPLPSVDPTKSISFHSGISNSVATPDVATNLIGNVFIWTKVLNSTTQEFRRGVGAVNTLTGTYIVVEFQF